MDFDYSKRIHFNPNFRNKHPESMSTNSQGQEVFDYVEKVASAQNFSEEFWKENWNIPTLKERKAKLNQEIKKRKSTESSENTSPPAKKKTGAKRGRKRKSNPIEAETQETNESYDDFDSNILKADKAIELKDTIDIPSSSSNLASIINPKEVSPFESLRSYMCGYCPKRSQNLDRIKRHHAHAHSEKECVWQELSRDQVVSIITSDQYAGKGDNDYKCFYCQVTI